MRRIPGLLAATLVFVAALALAEKVAANVEEQSAALAREQFSRASERLQDDVERRLQLPMYGLRGARATLLSDEGASVLNVDPRRERELVSAFVRARDLDREFPGVRGMGFIERIERGGEAALSESVRQSDAWSFAVRSQALLATDLYVITAIEPRWRNEPAFGFDVGSESNRRAAVEYALVHGEALSGPVTLMQDARRGVGMLLMVPVFSPGAKLGTDGERHSALRGLVYAPVIGKELFAGVERAADFEVDLDVYDVTEGPERMVFDSDDHTTKGRPVRDAKFAAHRTLAFGGRTLRVDTYSMPSFEAEAVNRTASLYRLFGALLALLAAVLTWVLGNARARARVLAEQMTADLRLATERAERMNRENASLHRALHTNFIVSVTDAAGTIISANDPMLELTGYSRDELMGANHRIVNSGTHPPEFWKAVWSTIARGESWRGEVCNKRRDGTQYWVDTVIAPLPDATGRTRRYVSIRTDVTRRKENELELARQTELARTWAQRAEEANQAKSSFLATMSHEIRTPMNGVLGMTELLLGMSLTPEQDEVARTISRSAEALLVILNDVLDFSKIEADKLEFENLAFDVHQVLYDTVELFKARALEKGIELLVRIGSDVPHEVMGDPTRVRQVVLNLIGNALKFTESGHVVLELKREENTLFLAVEDTGPGIPEERQRVLFQPFTQADVSTSRKHGGTGLGLAISRRLARGMGGDLVMQSTLGVGTRFTLSLPLGAMKPAVVSEGRRLEGKRVLVVDLHPLQRQLLSAALVEEGAQVESCATLEAAVHAMAASSFDVTLWDDRLVPATFQSGAHVVQQRARGRHEGAANVPRPAPLDVLVDALLSAQPGLQPTKTPLPVQAAHSLTTHLRVLVADDNAVNLRVARGMLERLGCEVTCVDDGARAVQAFEKGGWDVVFMDCQMPQLDGYEATARIRSLEKGRRTPIVAMTANASNDDRQRCLDSGMDDFLAKPCRIADLSTVLERWGRQRRAA
ncbi:MAG: response regulator [Archangium sp.]